MTRPRDGQDRAGQPLAQDLSVQPAANALPAQPSTGHPLAEQPVVGPSGTGRSLSGSPPDVQAGSWRPEQLRELVGIPFTDEQLAAASAPLAPGLIVAGAGSGKTSVMAARVVWLVVTGQVAPDQVLGLTFTNKAAAELAGRLRGALARAGVATRVVVGADGTVEEPGEPVVSTYHAFAGRLVTEHGLRLGVEPRSRLLADATRYQLAARVLRRHRGPITHLTSPLSMLVGDLVALEGELSEHLVSPQELLAWDADWLRLVEAECGTHEGQKGSKGHCDELRKMAAAARKRTELTALVRSYREAKADLDAIDFGDQVALAARLAETVPEVGGAERARSTVVLLDEYQDTSVAQRRMLVGLFGGGHPVTAVGDPCQAIYGWRGASVSNLDGFPTHFAQADGEPAEVFALAVNMRSGGRLLQLANDVAASLRLRHRVVELQAPPAKAELGDAVVALHTSWVEECAWVAQQIRTAVDAGTPARECAVLVRARSDFADLYAALTAAELPVEVVGLGGLLSLPEVADVLAVLEVLDDPTANAPLVRLLTGPRWRLGVRDLAVLGRRAREVLRADSHDGSAGDVDALEAAVAGVDPCDVVALSDALDRPGHEGWSVEALQRVTALNAELRLLRSSRDEPLLDLVHRVVEVTGLDVELAASPEAVQARRRESLSAFLDVVADFTDLDGETSLSSFLAFLRAAEEHERGLDAVSPTGSDAVQLLTAHRAKGLEWDVVACPDLTAKVFPSATLRGGWTSTAAVLPGPLRGDADDQPSLSAYDKQGLKGYVQECRDHLEREERRLGYVAFTRARHLLLGSGHWWGATQKKPRGPSPFLEELKAHAEAGGGTVALWADVPAVSSNPALAEPDAHVWPAPYAPEPYAARRSAADAVLADLAVLADGGALADDDLTGLTRWERDQLERYDREAQLLLEEERAARRGVREVALPTALSASQLLRLQDDPDAFARELARPLPRRPAPAASRGTRFHAWVEALFGERPLLDPDELPGSADDGLVDGADLLALQEAFLATPYAARKPHQVEAPFDLPLAGRVVRGRIDAVYELGGGRWEVVDWKTGRESADPLQLAVYRLAWARLVGVEPSAVDAAFLYVATGQVVRYGTELPGEAELAALLTGPVEAEPLTLL
ncbi:MAG: UvrD/REP helicase [Frankiales bacterium]|nr:UvrD/REP helicase [Frankiales bacterium]